MTQLLRLIFDSTYHPVIVTVKQDDLLDVISTKLLSKRYVNKEGGIPVDELIHHITFHASKEV